MTTLSPTPLMIRDELIGFARSRVMLILWILMPALTTLGYFLITRNSDLRSGFGGEGHRLSATAFMSFLMSSLAGTVAALMVAVDLVSERQRKVYELFVIRPVRRDVILWAKFVAVFTCVTVACVASLALGITVDALQGEPFTAGTVYDILKSILSLTGVIALSASVGVFFGVLSRTILVAVILILYVGQNVSFVPMLPVYLGVAPNAFWFIMTITMALVLGIMAISIVMFRRSEF